MPQSEYFAGHGNEVMASMIAARHGDDVAAKREFYATANAQHAKPGQRAHKRAHDEGVKALARPRRKK